MDVWDRGCPPTGGRAIPRVFALRRFIANYHHRRWAARAKQECASGRVLRGAQGFWRAALVAVWIDPGMSAEDRPATRAIERVAFHDPTREVEWNASVEKVVANPHGAARLTPRGRGRAPACQTP